MARPIPLHSLPVFSIVNPPDPHFDFNKGAAFLLDKPKGWTSHDLVKHVRKSVDMRQVGHAGTLDPMATGLVIVCCGHATKTISQIQGQPKAYEGEVTFGASTHSYDAETDIDDRACSDHITKKMVLKTLDQDFSGAISQIPPMYSAIKQDGTRLYKLARRGMNVEREPRTVTIHAARVISFHLPKFELYIKCSKGTYIRSIAHDLGKQLDSLGHLSALRRTGIGDFHLADALSVGDLDLIFDN
jgi:tRNA pseudouridine55 synthase